MTNVLTASIVASKRTHRTSSGWSSFIAMAAESSRRNAWPIEERLNERGGVPHNVADAVCPRVTRPNNRTEQTAIVATASESSFPSWLLDETKKIDWETFGG